MAEDLIPLIIANDTMAQAANRQPVMTGFISPESSMEFVMFRAFRNQKYEVGDELEHSFTIRRNKMISVSCRIAACHLVAVRASTCVVGVGVDGAVLPRKRVLEGVAHVEEAPGDDDVVVKGHVETDLSEEEEELHAS